MSSKQIVVPKDAKARAALDMDTAEPEDLIEVTLGAEEFRALLKGGVFDAINRVASSNIDEFEDEGISDPEALDAALRELRTLRGRSTGELAHAIDLLLPLFVEAQGRQTEVHFFL